MPQAVKISTNVISGSINKNGVSFNIEGAGRNFGSLDGGNWYSNVLPDDGRWVIISESKGSGKPAFWLTAGSANSDLLTTVNGLPSRYNLADFTATGSALDYLVQNDYMVLRAVPEQSDADSLEFYLDASNDSSYPRQGTTWYDISGYGNNGTLTNGPTFDGNQGIDFDGVDDHVVIPQIQFLPGEEFTAEALVNVKALNSGWAMLFGSTDSDNFIGIGDGGVILRVQDVNSTNSDLSYTSTLGVNTLIQVTQDGNTNQWYVNGENVGSSSNPIYGGMEIDRLVFYQTGNSLGIWNGTYFRSKLYRRALSTTEIKQNYFGGPIVTDGLVFNVDASNLVSYENGSTTTYSLTGSFTGALLNGTGWEPGNGGVFAFDGTNDKIRFSGFPQVFGGSITMECWIWWNDDSRSIILGNYNDGQNTSINFEKLTGRKLRMYWNQGERDIFGATNSVDLNTWQHIIIQRDKDANVFRFYINGELKQTTSNAGSDVPSTGNTWYVGADARDGSTVTNGNIAALRLYNRALTAEEIGQNYNAQKQKFQF